MSLCDRQGKLEKPSSNEPGKSVCHVPPATLLYLEMSLHCISKQKYQVMKKFSTRETKTIESMHGSKVLKML